MAERRELGAESVHLGSAGCLKLPNVLTCGIPQYCQGTSFSPGQLKGKLRRGNTWTTLSQTLLGFGCGGTQMPMSRKGSTFWKRPEPTAGQQTAGWVPARLGQSPLQLPPPASHPAHTCLLPRRLRCTRPPVQQYWAKGLSGWARVATSKAPRLFQTPHSGLQGLALTWNCQGHVPRPSQPQPGSKGTSSMKPPMTP